MLFKFKGGVHPKENKSTSDKHTVQFPIPPLIYIPLSQHIGKPAKPLVKKGDEVHPWQKIGDTDAFISATVHTPVGGKVKDIKDLPHPLGVDLPTIIIQTNPDDQSLIQMEPMEDFYNHSPSELIERIKEAGIVGMGGAGFPTYVKLSPPPDTKIDTVILNGAECEPFLTSDHRIMLERPLEIINGLRIIKHILGAKNAYIGIELNKLDAIGKLYDASQDVCTVIPLKVKYPQGAEKQLIKAITNKEVPSGRLPFSVGCYVQNVATAVAIYDAVVLGKPSVERIVTVTGTPLNNPQNILTSIGIPISALIESCYPLEEDIGKIISGGPMMGIAQYTNDVPVIKGMSGILLQSKRESISHREIACIQCGKCVKACPMGLLPTRIASNGEYGRYDTAKELGALDCIECGSCQYICPSKRKLLHYIKLAKAGINKKA